MERPPETKKDEQCPLLKVDIGNAEIVRQPSPVQSQSWSVKCVPNKSWLQRWPELVSVSWMTLIMLGFSFLIFYSLGMAVYKRQPLIIRYHDGKPGSNVFLHHIIHRGCSVPFALYSQYLSTMALTYPNLRFNVFFMVDDAMRNTYYLPKHARLTSRLLLGYQNKDEIFKQEVKEFEKMHSNINITVMSLSKYMAMTPLRFKWRTIPVSYLTFYTRVFSVWQNGGIGIDLTTYNNHFCNGFRFDRRMNEILKNHNDGLPIKDYNAMLQAIDEEEDNSYKCLKQILNDTISMFNSIFSFGSPTQTSEELPVNDSQIIKTQRPKRNSYNFYDIVTAEKIASTDGTISTETKLDNNSTLDGPLDNLKQNNSDNGVLKGDIIQTTSTTSGPLNQISEDVLIVDQNPETKLMVVGQNKSNNGSEGPQTVLFYDFSIMTDKVGHFLLREPLWPPFMLSGFGFNSKSEVEDIDKKKSPKSVAQLALGSDGLFIAATDRMHPFLGMLITAGFQRMRPEFAIQDTIITQCSGIYKNEAYCSIYRL